MFHIQSDALKLAISDVSHPVRCLKGTRDLHLKEKEEIVLQPKETFLSGRCLFLRAETNKEKRFGNSSLAELLYKKV